MRTNVAVAKVLSDRGITKYRLAQEMGCFPVSVNQWLGTTKMSRVYRIKFEALYGVDIDDTI